jgi:hypothetical protein
MRSKSIVLVPFALAAALQGTVAHSQTLSSDRGSSPELQKGRKAGGEDGGIASNTVLPYCDGIMVTYPTPHPSDYAGGDIALSGNTLLIGATGRDVVGTDNKGAVYFMVRSGANWLPASGINGISPGSSFGCSVAMQGDYAAAGARYAQPSGTNSGAAYSFHRTSPNTWQLDPVITAWDGVAGDEFGAEVAMGTDWLAIAAPLRFSGNAPIVGKVYVYRRFGSSWDWQVDFMMNQPQAGDALGTSLAMNGNMLAAGARGRDVGGHSDAGAVLVAEANLISQNPFAASWSKSAITANDAADNDHFGASLAMSDSFLYVGAPEADAPGVIDAGAVYVFQHTGFNTWQQVARVNGFNSNQHFGRDIAVDGQNIVISDSEGRVLRYKQPAPNVSLTPVCLLVRSKPANASSSYASAVAISGADLAMGDPGYNLTPNGSEGAVHVLAASANDDCSNAISLSHGVYQGCTVMATNDGSSPCGTSNNATDVWYRLTGTPGNTGPWILSIQSDYDSLLSAHVGACPGTANSAVACDDDGNGNWDARLGLTMAAGQTYLIRVSGYINNAGAFKLFARHNTCPSDIVPSPMGDQIVDVNDLLAIVTNWGPCPGSPCMADIASEDHKVDVNDLLAVITTWGACP